MIGRDGRGHYGVDMTRRNQIHLVLLTSLIILGSTAVSAQDPEASPDPIRTRGMAAVAEEFGTAEGHLEITRAGSETQILARYDYELVVYTAGDDITRDDRFVLCTPDSEGSLRACEGVDTAFECYEGGSSGDWCECAHPSDCIAMILADVCSAELTCDIENGGCACI